MYPLQEKETMEQVASSKYMKNARSIYENSKSEQSSIEREKKRRYEK